MIPHYSQLLRALTLNAIFSGFSALSMFVASSWLAVQFALDSPIPIYTVAGFLVVFAFQLANIVRTRKIRTWEISSIIIGDIAWVVASIVIVVLYYQIITPMAIVLLDVVALVVLFFAVVQIRGLEQYRKRY